MDSFFGWQVCRCYEQSEQSNLESAQFDIHKLPFRLTYKGRINPEYTNMRKFFIARPSEMEDGK